VAVANERVELSAYPPLVVYSATDKELFDPPPGETDKPPKWPIKGDQNTEVSHAVVEGYSRLEVQLKRSLSLAVSAKVAYSDTVSAEAEYGNARASRKEDKKEAFFLAGDIWVPKATIYLDLDTGRKYVNERFTTAVDEVGSDETKLFELLRDWGSLIAKKITVGGVLYIEDVRTDFQSFEAMSEANSFKTAVNVASGLLAGAATTSGSITEESQRQFNQSFKSSRMTCLGGSGEFALKKDMPAWVASLRPSSSWEAIRREDYLPVYMVLDDAPRARFLDMLVRAGPSRWKTQDVVPSLRFINYEWYVGFGEKRAYGKIFPRRSGG
jgi:hypothetical protein